MCFHWFFLFYFFLFIFSVLVAMRTLGLVTESLHWLLYRLFQIFVIGLLVQFFVHTLVTFQFGIDWPMMSLIWAWKELLIVLLGVWLVIYHLLHGSFIRFVRDPWISFGGGVVFLLIAIAGISSMWYGDTGMSWWIYSLKYNVFPFVICLVWYGVAQLLWRETVEKGVKRVGKVLMWVVFSSLLWFVVIWLKPWAIDIFGYDKDVHEWVVWEAPPAVYLSAYDHWSARNQFLFERPITWWFYLIAFWPFFFVMYLKKKSYRKTWLLWLVYLLAVYVTFSRAARWAWLVITFLMIALTYKRSMKRIIILWWVWLVSLAWIVGRWLHSWFFTRAFSDLWHYFALWQWFADWLSAPWWWLWWWSAGPASHQIMEVWFNPENQFLQVMIEYWMIWFLVRISFYLKVLYEAWVVYLKLPIKRKAIRSSSRYLLYRSLVALAVWLVWLWIEWLVLHSFGDRMVVYPFMAVLWFVLAYS